MIRCLQVSVLTFCIVFAQVAAAHEVRPAYLELRQMAADTYEVLWKVPALGDSRLGIYVQFPGDTKVIEPPRGFFSDNAYIERWRVQRANGLDGQSIHIDGLNATKIDVLARVERANGASQTTRVTPDSPNFVVEVAPSGWAVSWTYLVLGVEHILLGIDHLLFVLALVLLVKGWKRLLGTITAFTLAHSITLAAATLGFVYVPGPPVEACIALSIVFVAAEIIRSRQGSPGFTERAPWIVAFTFGLLHGLGFAGALSDVGLPQHAIPLALLFFNIGVELGQLFFIAFVLPGIFVLVRTSDTNDPSKPLPGRALTWTEAIATYTIGGIAAYWFIERTVGFVA